jgi:spore coat protein U-like protein
MKKVIFVLFALISGSAFAQNSSSATAPVNAEIVSPIGIALATGSKLDFGTFTTPETGTETVTISPDGSSRTFSSADMKITAFTSFSVPTFNVTNPSSVNYNIIVSKTQDPKAGSATMTLGALDHSLAADTGNNASSFTIGGEISVPAAQTAGTYIGEVKVTVAYD